MRNLRRVGLGAVAFLLLFEATDGVLRARAHYLDWSYLNGKKTAPLAGATSATLTFTLPTAPGTYNFRLFANNVFIKLATSPPVIVP